MATLRKIRVLIRVFGWLAMIVAVVIRRQIITNSPTKIDQLVEITPNLRKFATIATFRRHACGRSATTSPEIGQHGAATLRSRDGFAYGCWRLGQMDWDFQ